MFRRPFDILAILAGVAIMIGSFWPSSVAAGSVPSADKVLHFAAYGLLAGLALLHRSTPNGRTTTVLTVILFGVAIECIQPLSGREFSFGDIGANVLGVIGGVLGAWLIARSSFAGRFISRSAR